MFLKMRKKRDYYIVSKDTGFDFAIHMANARGMNNVFRRELFIYGENDNIYKTVVFNAKGDKVQEIRYEYDEHNEPISSTLFDYYEDPNEPELTITLYEYRYDEEGNWVTRYEYQVENDKKIPTYIVERDIKYY